MQSSSLLNTMKMYFHSVTPTILQLTARYTKHRSNNEQPCDASASTNVCDYKWKWSRISTNGTNTRELDPHHDYHLGNDAVQSDRNS